MRELLARFERWETELFLIGLAGWILPALFEPLAILAPLRLALVLVAILWLARVSGWRDEAGTSRTVRLVASQLATLLSPPVVALQPATGSRRTPGALALLLASFSCHDLAVACSFPLAGHRLLDGVQRWPDTGDVAFLVTLGTALRLRSGRDGSCWAHRTGWRPAARGVLRLETADRRAGRWDRRRRPRRAA